MDWQADLDRYLQYKNADISGGYRVVSAVEARAPWNFTPEMSVLTLGESMHYQTDIDYSDEMPDQEDENVLSEGASSGHLIPLPFPPEEIWCVFLAGEDVLDEDGLVEAATDLVLVALHQDLYNADYILHEIADGSQAGTAGGVARSVGCDIPTP